MSTIPQTADRLGVDRQTVYQWIKAGRVSATVDATGHYQLPDDMERPANKTAGRRVRTDPAGHP